MNENQYILDMRQRQYEVWLKMADNYLSQSDDDFLTRFSAYLREGYKDADKRQYLFNEPAWAIKQQKMLKEMLDFEAFRLPCMQTKGCALIGKTGFSKLEFIKNYFAARGLPEFTGGETDRCYTIVDCSGIKGYGGLIKALVKNKDVPYIIFDNCDSLLKHGEALKTFKQLSEDYPGFTIITKSGDSVDFATDSFFMFFGEQNTVRTAVDLATEDEMPSVYNHFSAFLSYIHVYDFDKGEQMFR
jgi:hypothetical protein